MTEAEQYTGKPAFEGRVALVTGAGRGIGAAIARELHVGGARVAVTDLDVASAEAVAKALDTHGETAFAFALDVREKRDFGHALDAVLGRWGKLDIVVNNAGYAKRTPLDEITPEEFDEIVNINMRSVFLSCQTFSKHMKSAGYGRIVNVTSLASHNGGTVASAHYSAAKGGAMTLTRYFARQLAGTGVTVNAVSPGPVSSAKERLAHLRDEISKQVPVGRFAEPEEIAAAVALLASERAGFMVGATIDVNGGLYMR
ncbi:short chain dehydrogenase family protein [Paraburkholderia xenovorans LB400]|uniref:Short-chain dehydrogenase n=1 Tax=Paraburkholderia xenovorans (strain LB400) TaxID=266265 RepID=Q143N3_PARXL|nr:SDR family NAD(P)-dependent oxidoreductase [Paraburkholderia xenovorans]ABE29456.1 Putative short-chain dehydrogenase [Paraburkholderia xenovorans LB400]AIP30525.1 short chain dehydrogenase family protein [Paraburkholderia xenovorans LB400]